MTLRGLVVSTVILIFLPGKVRWPAFLARNFLLGFRRPKGRIQKTFSHPTTVAAQHAALWRFLLHFSTENPSFINASGFVLAK